MEAGHIFNIAMRQLEETGKKKVDFTILILHCKTGPSP